MHRTRCALPLQLAGLLWLATPTLTDAQRPPDGAAITQAAERHLPEGFDQLREFLSLPNDAHFPQQVARNLEWVEAAFGARGFETTVLPTGGPPLLLASRPATSAAAGMRTVLVYLQIDGQPTAPDQWDQEGPFVPTLKRLVGADWEAIPWERLGGPERDPDWRMFARSAADAKGPVVMFLTALDLLAAQGWGVPFDLKVIMDFEEELGSPHLPEAVRAHRDALSADVLLIFDGPRHVSNRPSLTFGARGIATVTLRVFGPRVPQHSGHYGNYAPNPAVRLAQIIASMKDEDGRVTLPGWYDGVALDDEDRAELALVPDDEADIQRRLGIAAPDRVGANYQEAIQYPSLNVRGLSSGWVGEEVRTIIPATATAEIDIRLVPESDPSHLIGLVRNHVETLGYYLTDGEPTETERLSHPRLVSMEWEVSYGAFRTPMRSATGRWLRSAMVRAFGEEPVRKRMSGGSIPIAPFIETLQFPAVTVPTVNADNNQHSPNENLRVGNFVEGVRTFAAILTEPPPDR